MSAAGSEAAASRALPAASTPLAYDRSGVGDPLVLLHPLGADRHVWDPVLPLLHPHRDVLNVDLPGFGDSPALDRGIVPRPRELAGVVIGLLADLGLDGGRAHLAGNSLGGWVALEMAAAGHAASVTAIAAAGLWARPLAPKPQLARLLARFAIPALGTTMRSSAIRRLVLAGAVAHPERVPPVQAAALIRAYAQAPGFTAANRAMRAGRFTSLATIEVPVTLVWPQCDRLVARRQSVPDNVHQVLLPGCGHLPCWDDPGAVATALLSGSRHNARAAR
jgi:pimeloyl-ACP methyl ester carboxylesterase